jgi:hypothetical protein
MSTCQARFGRREYVVTQPFDTASDEDHVETVLRAEYALLCMAQAFKEEFDHNIEGNGVGNVPSMCQLDLYYTVVQSQQRAI